MSNIAFIIGSPRSGTTILGEIMDCHVDIVEWYEPYYVWEKHFNCKNSDIWDSCNLNITAQNFIRNEYNIFRKKSKKNIILTKMSNRHLFNVKLIHEIFPNAKWIHVIRDGRDVILSIKKEWDKRNQRIKKNNFAELIQTFNSRIRAQPFLRYKLMSVFFEMVSARSLNPLKYLNQSRWKGKAGWGPRFKGWEEFLKTSSVLEFNAMQWVECIKAVKNVWGSLPEKNRLEIRYEDLIHSPKEVLNTILAFLSVSHNPDFFNIIPKLKRSNFNKWEKEFNYNQLKTIGPIIGNELINLGYTENHNWYE